MEVLEEVEDSVEEAVLAASAEVVLAAAEPRGVGSCQLGVTS